MRQLLGPKTETSWLCDFAFFSLASQLKCPLLEHPLLEFQATHPLHRWRQMWATALGSDKEKGTRKEIK